MLVKEKVRHVRKKQDIISSEQSKQETWPSCSPAADPESESESDLESCAVLSRLDEYHQHCFRCGKSYQEQTEKKN